MRLHHSAIPKPDPVRIPTPRTPITAYAYCDDCGADAGTPCVDEDLRPCSMCPGRVLSDKASLIRRERVQRSSPAQPRKSRPPPRSTKCAHCGTPIRSDGRFCDARECRTARARVSRAARVQPSRATPLHPCIGCGVGVSDRRKYCEAKPCQYKRVRAYLLANPPPRPPRVTEGQPKEQPRLWVEECMSCGGPTNLGGSYCGAVACRAARKRDRRIANRKPVHCLGCQCEVKPGAKWCSSASCKAKRRAEKAAADKVRNDRRKVEVVLSGVEVLCGCGRRLLGMQRCRRCRRIEETMTPVCPGCHAPQSHDGHCSDLCAHISGLYLRDVRRRSSALTPPANSPA